MTKTGFDLALAGMGGFLSLGSARIHRFGLLQRGLILFGLSPVLYSVHDANPDPNPVVYTC
jgi:hypothetical protein